jgi:acetylornithine deacetylase/succinyl-diaminopimelate desuccinylase-like protein
MPQWFDELADFLKIPSVSADPGHRADVVAAGTWVRDFIAAGGGSAELIDWHGQPLVIGAFPATENPQSAPTILCYGHFDVQPPDPLELWETAPFELTERDIHLYARGIADDKGQLYLLLAAARELAASDALPVNVRFVCDGEEETGGHSIVEFIEQDTAKADAAVIFDSGMIAYGLPAFNVAMRGMVYLHLTLTTGRTDLHSGMYGGAALNAAAAMITTLGALLPTGAHELELQGANPADPTAAEEFYLRTFAEPTFEINGIHSGSPQLEKTVLPVEAIANVSLRLAPGQNPREIGPAAERLLREALPAGATLKVEHLSSAPPGVVAPDSAAVQRGLDAFEAVLGQRPALIRNGGSLPVVAALSGKGIDTIISGFSLPDANIHAPNERLRTEYVPQGIEAAKALFAHLGKL